MVLKKTQKSLKKWGTDKYTTPSGKKSSVTGEVYLPKKQITKLKSTPKGKQYSKHGLHKGKKRS